MSTNSRVFTSSCLLDPESPECGRVRRLNTYHRTITLTPNFLNDTVILDVQDRETSEVQTVVLRSKNAREFAQIVLEAAQDADGTAAAAAVLDQWEIEYRNEDGDLYTVNTPGHCTRADALVWARVEGITPVIIRPVR